MLHVYTVSYQERWLEEWKTMKSIKIVNDDIFCQFYLLFTK
jgi:hypothetical protein